jgi:hypothetical protein
VALNNGLSTFATIATSRGKAVTNLLPQNLPAAQNLTCDLNGNLTSDGLHGYVYDCANELTLVPLTHQPVPDRAPTEASPQFGKASLNFRQPRPEK